LFWDVKLDQLDLKRHKSLILERVFNYGQLKDFKLVLQLYGIQEIQREILQLKNLSDKSLHFLSFYFSIPKNQFKCYIRKQSKKQHWNY
jgi:hypothetical protein